MVTDEEDKAESKRGKGDLTKHLTIIVPHNRGTISTSKISIHGFLRL